MKKIIITLSIAVIVFMTTLLITDSYISNKSIKAADAMVMQKMDSFCSDFDSDLLMTKNVVYGFLSGNLISDSTRNTNCFFVDDSKMHFFGDGLKERLVAFLESNPYFESATFIIEKDTVAPMTKESYYAPLLIQGSDEFTDLAQDYDISKSQSIKKCKATLKPLWSLPSRQFGRNIVCFYVPLCRNQDGSFLGAFSITLNISTLEGVIKNHLPYGSEDSGMMITDADGRIVSAFPRIRQDKASVADIKSIVQQKDFGVINDTVNNRTVVNYDGAEYFLYQHNLKRAPWTIITGCKSSAVYAESNNLKHMVLITSLIGMLLMLVSCIVVMMQIYQTHRKKVAAENELNMASKVQMSLLRKRDHKTPHYSLNAYLRPARQAGGDLYDYVEVEGKLVFCIGDVSGKGMPAALFMTQVMSLFRSAVKHSIEPSFILSYINEVMAEDNPAMTFCTFFVGILDGTTLTYSNAGHNNPLILPSSHDAPPFFLNTDSNFPIGVEEDVPYVSVTHTLHEGEAIVLYTDGVTEAMNNSGKQFGDQRMVEALTARSNNDPQHCVDLLLTSVSNYVGGAVQSDDLTVFTITPC